MPHLDSRTAPPRCSPEAAGGGGTPGAFDATVQIQILLLLLLRELQRDLGLSVLFGTARTLIRAPRHPCTIALLKSRAHGAPAHGLPLETIGGPPPDLSALPPDRAFADRCPLAVDACRQTWPALVHLGPTHRARCLRTDVTAGIAIDAALLAPVSVAGIAARP
jgi:peptide/nickel transport system ATP-binding protein